MFFDYLHDLKNKIPKKYVFAFFSTIVIGFLAHGMMFLNKYAFHDEAHFMCGVGYTYESGRWGLGLMESLIKYIFGGTYSMPLINGLVSIICIALTVCCLVYLFKVEDKILIFLMAGLSVANVSVIMTFAYMFTAPYYFFALFLTALGAVIIAKKKNILWLIVAMGCIAFGMGIYQSYFGCATIMLCTYFIYELVLSEDEWKASFGKALRYVVCLLLSMTGYMVFNKLFLEVKQLELFDYKGMNTIGTINLTYVLQGIKSAYKSFFYSVRYNIFKMSPNFFVQKGILIMWLLVGLVLLILFRKKVKGTVNKVLFALAGLLVPLAMNIVWVMINNGTGSKPHPIMTYSFIFMFIFPILMLNLYCKSGEKNKKLINVEQVVLSVVLLVTIVWHVVFANIAYFRYDMMQTHTDMYYNTLITRIRSVEGYDDELKVAFIGEQNANDNSLYYISNDFPKYDMHTAMNQSTPLSTMNCHAWIWYMVNRCGFSPVMAEWGETNALKQSEEVKNMPCYPDDGSIKVVDGIVVIKLAN